MMSVALAAPPGPTPVHLNGGNNRDLQQQGFQQLYNNAQHVRCNSNSFNHGTKGLLNRPGQNNCFLNSAVQVLWHLDIFRRSFRDLTGHACMAESCIFCALKELFAQFQYSQESALPPDALRRALAETFFDQQRFQLGFMDDAAECFENMLLRIHFHIANTESEDMCNAVHCISHQKFAMTLVEQSVCHVCGATSEPLPFTQMVHYISASALCIQAQQMWSSTPSMNPTVDFGKLLRRAGGMGDVRDCPSSCGARIQICRSLMNRPEIVSVGIVWDSERPTLEHIMNVFGTIGTTLKLQDLYHSVVDNRWASSTVHHLVGVVTYYGKHYSTFFFHTKLRVWIYFDDAAVREIGPRWEQVVEKCQRGHFQPLLLLYSNPQGSSVAVDTAPQAVTYVAGHNKKQTLTSAEGLVMKNTIARSLSDDYPPSKPLLHPVNGSTKNNTNPNYLSVQRRAMTPNPEPSRDHAAIISAIKETNPRRAITPNPAESRRNTNSSQFPVLPTYDEVDASRRSVLPQDQQQSNPNPNNNNNIYISRRAVENVLNYQKLQRQRSLNYGRAGSVTGSRNSSSSMESFESSAALMGLTNGIHQPNTGGETSGNVGNGGTVGQTGSGQIRRRDSGNWSGDRNSASSASSLSLETNPVGSGGITGSGGPMPYIVNGKWLQNGGPSSGLISRQCASSTSGLVNGKPVELTMANPTYDPGYDSYSLSSNDSFPHILAQQQQQLKHLAQIPENPNHAWLALSPHHLYQDVAAVYDNASMEDCEFLCAEADTFLAKSQEVEASGNIVAAISLCNSAAAKARAAMDAPYHNSQSIVLAQMKHNTCVMKARSLQRRFLMRQESLNSHGSTTSTETDGGESSSAETAGYRRTSHSRQGSRDGGGSNGGSGSTSGGNHSRQGSRESRHSLKETSGHGRQGSKDGSHKKIEIYATLPKRSGQQQKGLPGRGGGSVRIKDEQVVYQNYLAQRQQDGTGDSGVTGSDYSTEWETTKKRSLHRTLSSPPALKETNRIGDQSKVSKAPEVHVASPPVPGKKQHKIRRKLLMGGLIRRKNRSMPDLREGQQDERGTSGSASSSNGTLMSSGVYKASSSTSFADDSSFNGTSHERSGYLSDAHLDYGHRSASERCLLSKQQLSNSSGNLNAGKTPPPRPPARTTSQLSLGSHVQYLSNGKSMNASSPNLTRLVQPPYQNVPGIYHQDQRKAIDVQRLPLPPKPRILPVPPTQDVNANDAGNSRFLAELQAKRKQMMEKKATVPSLPVVGVKPEVGCSEERTVKETSKTNQCCNWLQELQAKQNVMLQQRRNGVVNSNTGTPITDNPVVQNCVANVQPTVLFSPSPQPHLQPPPSVKCSIPAPHLSNPAVSTNVCDDVSRDGEEIMEPSSIRSVRDLASRFEQIILPNPPKCNAGGGQPQQQVQCCPSKNLPDRTQPIRKIHENPPGLPKTNEQPQSFSSSPNYPPGPSTQYTCPVIPPTYRNQNGVNPAGVQRIRNPYLQQPSPTNLNYQQFTDPPVPSRYSNGGNTSYYNGNQFQQSNGFYRPVPPDCNASRGNGTNPYQMIPPNAAAVRLAHDTSINGDLGQVNGNCKKVKKKSVTFSDQVALVASADEGHEPPLPNPLFDRVYKTVVAARQQQQLQELEPQPMMNGQCNHRQQVDGGHQVLPVQTKTPVVPVGGGGVGVGVNGVGKVNGKSGRKVPCHLCRKKSVLPPTVYCPDCEFYMSRFRPKV